MATSQDVKTYQSVNSPVKFKANAADLPYELWLNILESITHDHTLARPKKVDDFVNDVAGGRSEEEAVGKLFEFEKRAWRATRPYYAINRKARWAAQQLSLSMKLLQTCQSPIHPNPSRLWLYATEIPETDFKAMRPQLNEEGIPCPTYMAVEFLDAFLLRAVRLADQMARSDVSDSLGVISSLSNLISTFAAERLCRFFRDNKTLQTVRSVDLLCEVYHDGMSPDEASVATVEVRKNADRITRAIMEEWKCFGVTDGVVRLMR